jgi:hypothetical protein
MKKWFTLILLIMSLHSFAVAEDNAIVVSEEPDCGPVKVKNKNGWCVLRIEMEGDLSKILEFGDCKYISGLSCDLSYNGELPFPDKVLFDEYDENGKLLAKDVRLLFYTDPEKKGSARITGAMFRFKSNPSRIVLRGIWNHKD